MIPNFEVNGEKQDILLRMSDNSEPFWVAIAALYKAAIKDNYFNPDLSIPNLWSEEFDQLYIHWRNNFHANLFYSSPQNIWVENNT